jgi:hypothetical protein
MTFYTVAYADDEPHNEDVAETVPQAIVEANSEQQAQLRGSLLLECLSDELIVSEVSGDESAVTRLCHRFGFVPVSAHAGAY